MSVLRPYRISCSSSVRALFSEICHDPSTSSINLILSEECTARFRAAVGEILLTREIFFPRQVIFQYQAQLFIFFDGSLQGYGACVYAHSGGQFNLISSSSKILGKSVFSAPQSEMAGAILASRMEQKISQKLFNFSLPLHSLEIVLRMVAKNDPAGNPMFYGVRLMEILASSSPNNWFWCPGDLNPADLLTRSGTSCAQINSKFWLNGSFLPQERSSWPMILCSSIITSETPILWVNLSRSIPVNPSQGLILNLLQHTQSFSAVL